MREKKQIETKLKTLQENKKRYADNINSSWTNYSK